MDTVEPLTNIARVEFSLGVVVLFLEGRRLIDDFPLGRTAVHAHFALGARVDLLHFLDDLEKFRGSNTVLGDDVSDSVAVVLFALLRVGAGRSTVQA